MLHGRDASNKSVEVEIPEVSTIKKKTKRNKTKRNKTERTPLNRGVFTSNRGDWETPVEVFQELDREFGFELDVCATASNAKCSAFFSPEIDGLRQPWRGRCWMNPPYGRDIGLWMEKAYHSSLQGATVVCLIPARTDTRWWNEWAMRGEIRFLKGRIRFVGALDDAPFPSVIVVFRPKTYQSMTARPGGVKNKRKAG